MRVPQSMTSPPERDRRRIADPTWVGQTQGAANIVGGLWPLVGLRSFEAVFGPKVDRWLVFTVAGMLITTGANQVLASRRGDVVTARGLGVGTAATLASIDLVYVPRGRIRWTYLLDAVVEVSWIVLWRLAGTSQPRQPLGPGEGRP
jgi:hypothetical protein